MRKTIVVLSGLLAAAALVVAAEAGVSGKWKMTTKTQRGERSYEMSLVQDGEKLTVQSKDREGKDVTSEGTVKGNEIRWTTKRTTPMGELLISYTGKVDGKSMSGASDAGNGRTGEWKAEKIEP